MSVMTPKFLSCKNLKGKKVFWYSYALTQLFLYHMSQEIIVIGFFFILQQQQKSYNGGRISSINEIARYTFLKFWIIIGCSMWPLLYNEGTSYSILRQFQNNLLVGSISPQFLKNYRSPEIGIPYNGHL